MTMPSLLLAEPAGGQHRLSLPEYRQIELYSKRKTLSFAPPDPAPEVPVGQLAGLCRAYAGLDFLLCPDEAKTTWQRYLALPRATRTDKLVAELYRVLRVARAVLFHPHGHVEMGDGIVKINGAIDMVALSLEITVAGLGLLESMVAWYAQSLRQPYPAAYVEAMLGQYFFDIVAEIKRFADEDRVLYQFRRKYAFARHYRFDCDNPKSREEDGKLVIEIGALHRDPVAHPIDFFVIHDGKLHIVPVEALTDGVLALDQLPEWRARLTDGISLPADFRQRFGREAMVVGQPMT